MGFTCDKQKGETAEKVVQRKSVSRSRASGRPNVNRKGGRNVDSPGKRKKISKCQTGEKVLINRHILGHKAKQKKRRCKKGVWEAVREGRKLQTRAEWNEGGKGAGKGLSTSTHQTKTVTLGPPKKEKEEKKYGGKRKKKARLKGPRLQKSGDKEIF